MKECDIWGVKTYSDPPTYFQDVKTPTPRIYAPGYAPWLLLEPKLHSV